MELPPDDSGDSDKKARQKRVTQGVLHLVSNETSPELGERPTTPIPDMGVDEQREIWRHNLRARIRIPHTPQPGVSWAFSTIDLIDEYLAGRDPIAVGYDDAVDVRFAVSDLDVETWDSLDRFAQGVCDFLKIQPSEEILIEIDCLTLGKMRRIFKGDITD